jgi:hypothetical protein
MRPRGRCRVGRWKLWRLTPSVKDPSLIVRQFLMTGRTAALLIHFASFRRRHHWRVPIVRDATPDDAESIGWHTPRLGGSPTTSYLPVPCWKLRWVSAVACGAVSSVIQHSVERC